MIWEEAYKDGDHKDNGHACLHKNMFFHRNCALFKIAVQSLRVKRAPYLDTVVLLFVSGHEPSIFFVKKPQVSGTFPASSES